MWLLGQGAAGRHGLSAEGEHGCVDRRSRQCVAVAAALECFWEVVLVAAWLRGCVVACRARGEGPAGTKGREDGGKGFKRPRSRGPKLKTTAVVRGTSTLCSGTGPTPKIVHAGPNRHLLLAYVPGPYIQSGR